MSIADEKYVALTTYRRDGTPKSLPVWIVGLDEGRVGFTTGLDSWKVKRLRNDPRVTLQPSNGRGEPTAGSSPVSGTGEVVEGAAVETVRAAIKKKYGLTYHMIGVVTWIGSLFGKGATSDGAVVITLD